MKANSIFNTLLIAGAVTLAIPAQATLLGRDINGNGVLTTANNAVYLYDDVANITWLLDANYAATELNDARRNQIIAEVGSVDGHTLVATDFLKSGTSYTGRMNWWGATAWADQLSYGGFANWSLPKTTGVNCFGYECTNSQMGDLYEQLGDSYSSMTAVFDNVQSYVYWSGTGYAPYPDAAWDFSSRYGYQGYGTKDYQFYALAVRPGDVAAASVPEPETLLLAFTALAGLGFVRRRQTVGALAI
jgi:hypothetical protein